MRAHSKGVMLAACVGMAVAAVVTGHSGALSPWHLMFLAVPVKDAPAALRNGTRDA